jgi:perosamine synthetase
MPGIIFQAEQNWARHVYWMFSIVLEQDIWADRDVVIEILRKQGIETRPVFYPAHSMPPYIDTVSSETFPVAEKLSGNGISLPTWVGLTENDIDCVCRALQRCRKKD